MSRNSHTHPELYNLSHEMPSENNIEFLFVVYYGVILRRCLLNVGTCTNSVGVMRMGFMKV